MMMLTTFKFFVNDVLTVFIVRCLLFVVCCSLLVVFLGWVAELVEASLSKPG
jgi:hypothetical protein